MRLMTLGHVLVNGRVPIKYPTARMGRDALAILEKLDGGCGVTGFELLTGKLIRNTVVVPVDLDVVVDVGADRFPFCHHVAFDRQTTLELESGKPGPRHENVRGAGYYDPPTTLLQ